MYLPIVYIYNSEKHIDIYTSSDGWPTLAEFEKAFLIINIRDSNDPLALFYRKRNHMAAFQHIKQMSLYRNWYIYIYNIWFETDLNNIRRDDPIYILSWRYDKKPVYKRRHVRLERLDQGWPLGFCMANDTLNGNMYVHWETTLTNIDAQSYLMEFMQHHKQTMHTRSPEKPTTYVLDTHDIYIYIHADIYNRFDTSKRKMNR